MDKKTITIIILSVIIIGLVWLIFSGKGDTNSALESLRNQRIEFARTTEIIQRELITIKGYNKELEKDSIELERITDELTSGNEKTGGDLKEYEGINSDFAKFLRQATITD